VAVGGTVVTEDHHTSSTSEYAWIGSGGGTSFYEPAPAWQQKVPAILGRCVVDPATVEWVANTPQGHWLVYNGTLPPPTDLPTPPHPTGIAVPCRGLPDVAAQSGDATAGFNTVVNGSPTNVSGTSLSAPLWQGMWARVQAASTAPGRNGFAAPVLYRQAAQAYARDFFDITTGDNLPFPATTGWDYVSGWGSPNVTNLTVDVDGSTTPH
jgi:subtilase family serine protease